MCDSMQPFRALDEQSRRQSYREALSKAPQPGGDIWIFAYGSLLWDQPFDPIEIATAHLPDWRRAMCVWTVLARGTPARPGLSLGLLPGGGCDGAALCIARQDLEQAIPAIWQREMWTDIYRPTWVSLETHDGKLAALTFTVNRGSRQFAKDLSWDHIVRCIAEAQGERGACRDYLANTVTGLRALGIEDAELAALHDAVVARLC